MEEHVGFILQTMAFPMSTRGDLEVTQDNPPNQEAAMKELGWIGVSQILNRTFCPQTLGRLGIKGHLGGEELRSMHRLLKVT